MRDLSRVVAVAEIDASAVAAPLQFRLAATPRDGAKALVHDASLEVAGTGVVDPAPAPASWRVARFELELPAGVHGLRGDVRDPASGRAGFVEQRIVVPETAGLRLSTLILSDRATSSGGGEPSPTPVAHDAFAPRPGRPLLAAFEVYGAARDPAGGRPDVAARVVLEDSAGRPLTAPPANSLAPSPDGRLRQTLALPALPGGDYALVVAVLDRVAGTRQEARRTFRVLGSSAAVATAAPPAAPAPAVPPELAAILDRAGRYVVAYGQAFSNIVAVEECRQTLRTDDLSKRAVRATRAGVFFVTLPGPLPWVTFRDVWEVDGSRIGDRGERLLRLFRDSPATARERARAILEESARYNLGPARRTVNIPTLALLFLHPDNRGRFAWELKGRPSARGAGLAEVEFVERGRPTLVAGDTGAGAPARGRVWIEPQEGTVVKTDARYDLDPHDRYHRSGARVMTEYRAETGLGLLVPDRMTESYTSLAPPAPGRVLPDAHARASDPEEERALLVVEASTRYSGYRRFDVETEETYTAAPKDPD